jgi:hypothetical protein
MARLNFGVVGIDLHCSCLIFVVLYYANRIARHTKSSMLSSFLVFCYVKLRPSSDGTFDTGPEGPEL